MFITRYCYLYHSISQNSHICEYNFNNAQPLWCAWLLAAANRIMSYLSFQGGKAEGRRWDFVRRIPLKSSLTPSLIPDWDNIVVKTYRPQLVGWLSPTHVIDKIPLFFCLHLFKHENRYKQRCQRLKTGDFNMVDNLQNQHLFLTSAKHFLFSIYVDCRNPKAWLEATLITRCKEECLFTYFLVVQVPVCRQCPASPDPVWGWVTAVFRGF